MFVWVSPRWFPVRCNGAEAGALQRAVPSSFPACRATCMSSCCVVPHIFSPGCASLRALPSHFSCIFGNGSGHRIMFYLELLRGHLCDIFSTSGVPMKWEQQIFLRNCTCIPHSYSPTLKPCGNGCSLSNVSYLKSHSLKCIHGD